MDDERYQVALSAAILFMLMLFSVFLCVRDANIDLLYLIYSAGEL